MTSVRKLSSSTSLPQETALDEPRYEGFEVDLQLHKQVGHLAGNFHCIYNNTRGSLFCGSGGCSFVGWTLFFEKRVELDWSRVLQVVKSTFNGTSGITFVMQNNHEEYTFTGLVHADRVWATLVNLHNESLHNNSAREPLVTPLRTSLRRMSTDPVYPTSITDATHDNTHSPSVAEAAYIAAASVANNDEFRASVSSRNMAARSVSSRRSLMLNSPIHLNAAEEGDFTTETSDDLQEAWKELTSGGTSGNESYATVAIQDKIIPCTLDEFLHKFVDTDATFPYSEYMQSSGDDILQVTEWKLDDDETGVYSRMLEYNHPVNAPLAPPMAKARKEQRYRKYGETGLSIETDTFVQDVPMADCFYVTDRVLVEPHGDGAVIVVAEFDIRFVKSTMFRSLISNTTKSEFLKWFQGLGVYWAESIVSPVDEMQEEEQEEQYQVVSPRRRRSSIFAGSIETVLVESTKAPVVVTSTGMLGASPILTGLVILVFVMQMWIMMEMMGIKRTMVDMELKMAMQDASCPSLDT